MKVAIISPMFFPEHSRKKLNVIKRTLDSISYNTGVDFDFYTCIDGLDAESERLYIELINNFSGEFVKNKIIIKNEKNEGISVSFNKILSLLDSSYTHVCTLDLDVQLPPNWLYKCCSVLDAQPLIGVCGVLVEDYLKNGINRFCGSLPDKPHIQFTQVDSIGGACLVFRSFELKQFKYDERLKVCHVDANILSKYISNRLVICAILDRGYHDHKQKFESEEWVNLKNSKFNEELPIFKELLNNMSKGN